MTIVFAVLGTTLVWLGLLAFLAPHLQMRALRQRAVDGTSDTDDVLRLLVNGGPNVFGLDMEVRYRLLRTTGVRYEPVTVVRWLLAGKDPNLLVACMDAGLTDAEVEADGLVGAPVTLEQVRLLAALRNPSGSGPSS